MKNAKVSFQNEEIAFFECILKEGKIEEQLSGLKTPVVGNQTPHHTRFL